MFRYYLVTAARGLLRHKLYSFVNVAGFSIALAAAILITLYVRDQLSYDHLGPRDVSSLQAGAGGAGSRSWPAAVGDGPFPGGTGSWGGNPGGEGVHARHA